MNTIKNSNSPAAKYKTGDSVWFLKSMRMCKFIEVNKGGKTCTVERWDGRQLTALYPSGIKPVNPIPNELTEL